MGKMQNNILFISIFDICAKFHAKKRLRRMHSFVITCNYYYTILFNMLYLIFYIKKYCLVWHSWGIYTKLFNMCSNISMNNKKLTKLTKGFMQISPTNGENELASNSAP
jgi:hypothetical protein